MISWVRVYLLIPFIIFPFFFFNQALFSYFSQDDFFHLRQVMDKKIEDFPSFFVPALSPEQTFYRPLSREVYNFVMYSLFDFSPLPYHLVNLLLILAVVGLIFWFVLALTKQKIIAFFSSLLYLFNSIHSVELYYLSSVQTLFSTVFVLFSLITYLSYLRSNKVRYIFYSSFCYALAILSHESAAAAFFLIITLDLAIAKSVSRLKVKKIIFRVLPFAVVLFIRLLIFNFRNALPSQAVYQPNFSLLSIANTFSWFTLWSFGLPEMLTDFITLTFKVNPNLIRFYSSFITIVFPLFIIFLGLNLLIIFLLRKRIFGSKIFFYFLGAYIISMSPFLFFPQHKFSYYLSLPLVWFSILLGFIFSLAWVKYKKLRIVVISLLAIFLLISFQTVSLNKDTHWAAKRAVAAKAIMMDFRKMHPTLNPGTNILLENDPTYPFISREWGGSSTQAFYILSGSDAFELLYKDPTIKVFFEDKNDLPKDFNSSSLIYYTPNFPY